MTTLQHLNPEIRDVLDCYDSQYAEAIWTPLGNAGGFSGARLWRGETADGRQFALRAWPTRTMNAGRLQMIHRATSALSCFSFVPGLVESQAGETFVQIDYPFWEITEWMPGTADFHQMPTDARLFAAVRSLAMMHERLAPAKETFAPCPAVRRILAALRDWRDLLQSGWKPNLRLPLPQPIPALARRAWEAIAVSTYSIEFTLAEWEQRPMPVQVCLCDIWHDHVLYEDNEVTGIIDYGAVKPDCVAVDLARLLGSMIPDQSERMHAALGIYSAIHAVPSDVLKLASVLDRAGSVIGLTNWLRWLYLDEREYVESAGVAKRMTALLNRAETKVPTGFFPWV